MTNQRTRADFKAGESLEPFTLQKPLVTKHVKANTYTPASGLFEAMDTAMMLGVPLLITGEPGTGKTQAAYWLKDLLGLELFDHDTKSTTMGKDLFYSFDEVARFRDSSGMHPVREPLVDYLQFNAVGKAVLLACGPDAILCDNHNRPLSGAHYKASARLIERVFGQAAFASQKAATVAMLMPQETDFAKAKPQSCVVLVDEIDKAPREMHNDVLAEIDRMSFVISELGIKVPAPEQYRPIVIMTSNREKTLPEPFLRRCSFFHIDFPDAAALASIVVNAVYGTEAYGKAFPALIQSAVRAVERLRTLDLIKKPGTAEIIAWIDVLAHWQRLPEEQSLQVAMVANPDFLDNSLGILFKNTEDRKTARAALASYILKDDYEPIEVPVSTSEAQ